MSALSTHILDEIKALPARYPQPRSAVMPALDLAQEELGHLTPEAMSEVAAALQLDPGYVEGVATFYTLFHLEPIGKHRFYMCTNLSCMLRGAEDLVAHLRQTIGVREAGEVSRDGLFSYEEVECMGACEYAPMCRVDRRYHYDLTPSKLDELVAERRNPRADAPPAQRGEVKRHLPAGGEVRSQRDRGGEAQRADAPPHPPAAPGTSPQSGEVKPHLPAGGEGGALAPGGERKARKPRRKKADG